MSQPDAAAALGASHWDLVEWTGKTAPGGKRLRLDFDPANHRFSSSTMCNRVMGGYQAEGSSLKMGAGRGTMASTMMACPEPAMTMERAYVDALSAVTGFSLSGDRLILNSANGVTLTYQAAYKPAASAPRKFIYVSAETRPCTGVAPMTCLQIREKETDRWQLHYGPIGDFEPEPGIEYRLRIIEEKVDNPPADASSIRWTLDQVIEQRVVSPAR
ncbi:META domain-containing protein [Sphingomonas cavernae]|uniref:META domain-containing protein n=2 Tax=Sphingomonas cavernae TaxID=2320861 RepID=A0A418W819_9SPHN|nr:META domain-containing protein [Sphingomonas cavernae]